MKNSKKFPIWIWSDGIGFLPPEKPFEYGKEYFEKYIGYESTEQGRVILGLRVKMLRRRVKPSEPVDVLDVGIGSGIFVSVLRSLGYFAWGTDVNPYAIEWLERKGWFFPEGRKATVLTFWDSLEHILNPVEFIRFHDPRWVFVSMPIYKDEADCLASKHFKPNEHIWYFTERGLVGFMDRMGFECVERNWFETTLGGRENIMSFAFRRLR
jgi:hypothetical protein